MMLHVALLRDCRRHRLGFLFAHCPCHLVWSYLSFMHTSCTYVLLNYCAFACPCRCAKSWIFYREIDGDVPALKHTAMSIVQECSSGPASISDDLVGEMCRFGAGELHCVAAVMGGMASQEAIKLITNQFVPINGTIIYNAMNSTMSVFRF